MRGLNAMPFRTEARKCNHWATGALLEWGAYLTVPLCTRNVVFMTASSCFGKYAIKIMKDLA